VISLAQAMDKTRGGLANGQIARDLGAAPNTVDACESCEPSQHYPFNL
jgi:hypothetical protein